MNMQLFKFYMAQLEAAALGSDLLLDPTFRSEVAATVQGWQTYIAQLDADAAQNPPAPAPAPAGQGG